MIYEYIIGLLIISSLLLAWFNSDLPVHVFHFLRRLGWRNEPGFWEAIPEFETDRQRLFDYLVIDGRLPLLVDLLSCRVCFSFHAALWVSVVMFLFTGIGCTQAIAQALSYPILANFIINFYNRTQK